MTGSVTLHETNMKEIHTGALRENIHTTKKDTRPGHAVFMHRKLCLPST